MALTSKISYRLATLADAPNVAELHVKNWQKFYRGMWSDNFLHNIAPEKQLQIWTDRLTVSDKNQRIFLAEAGAELVGFACTQLEEDPKWGALLDNLHVDADWQGNRIGQRLIKDAGDWVLSQNPTSDFYLLVLEDNLKSRNFYKKCGAEEVEIFTDVSEELGTYNLIRCFWKGVKIMIEPFDSAQGK